MNYALGHAFNLKHLFENFNLKRLKMSCNDCLDITGYTRHRDILAQQIFKESVKLVINDIIDNNVTFKFPGDRGTIHMGRVTGEEFVTARQNGKWQDIDFIASFFSGYELYMTMLKKDGSPTRIKPIYVDKKLKQKIIDNTNNGKQYY